MRIIRKPIHSGINISDEEEIFKVSASICLLFSLHS
jgi:hypothetical protein